MENAPIFALVQIPDIRAYFSVSLRIVSILFGISALTSLADAEP